MGGSLEETVAALLTRVDELSDLCGRLSRENVELQRRIATTPSGAESSGGADERGARDSQDGRKDRPQDLNGGRASPPPAPSHQAR